MFSPTCSANGNSPLLPRVTFGVGISRVILALFLRYLCVILGDFPRFFCGQGLQPAAHPRAPWDELLLLARISPLLGTSESCERCIQGGDGFDGGAVGKVSKRLIARGTGGTLQGLWHS